jgi:hypothetical protein
VGAFSAVFFSLTCLEVYVRILSAETPILPIDMLDENTELESTASLPSPA